MPAYNYKAKNPEGQDVTSVVTAASRLQALAMLRHSGLTVLELWAEREKSVRAALNAWFAPRVSQLPGPLISASEQANFMRQLSISVGAGMPLRDALEAIAEDHENKRFRRIGVDLVAKLREGRMFSEAAAAHPAVFSRLSVSLLRVAEEAGSLPQTLDHLATSLERSAKLERKMRGIAAYPVFVAGFFILICSTMTIFVLPKFQANYTANGSLPLLSRVVFGVNNFLLNNCVPVAAALVGSVALFIQYARSPIGRRQLDVLKIRCPIVGPCIQKFAVARFCRNFAIMLRGGVPVATALEIATMICNNSAMEDALSRARDRIIGGSTIALALSAETVIPRLIVRMVGVGEASGKLPLVLDKVSDTYEDQVESSITVAMALLEPIMICFFGFCVLILVLAIYLPVFTAARGVQ